MKIIQSIIVLSIFGIITTSSNAGYVGSLRPVYIESYVNSTSCPSSDAFKLVSSDNQSTHVASVKITMNDSRGNSSSSVRDYTMKPLQQTFIGCRSTFGASYSYELINSYKIN